MVDVNVRQATAKPFCTAVSSNSMFKSNILEHVGLFPENTVTKEDINWIILISLIDFNSEIPPGSRILLYTSDTIN